MRLHEAKELELSVVNTKMAEEVICSCLCMTLQAHIWHWQTSSYGSHKALGEFYEGLQSYTDELAEIFLGAGGKITFRQHQTAMNFISIDDTLARLKNFKSELIKTQANLMKEENSPLHSTGDKILEVVKLTDKTLYLLSLK